AQHRGALDRSRDRSARARGSAERNDADRGVRRRHAADRGRAAARRDHGGQLRDGRVRRLTRRWARASRAGRRGCLQLLAMSLALAAPASASDDARRSSSPDSFLRDFVRDVRARIDDAILARPPKLVPPTKIDVRWRLAKVGSIEIGASLVALAGGDLDGDGKGELYAVTPRDVIAIGVRGGKLVELG